jgi:hypothetical protein
LVHPRSRGFAFERSLCQFGLLDAGSTREQVCGQENDRQNDDQERSEEGDFNLFNGGHCSSPILVFFFVIPSRELAIVVVECAPQVASKSLIETAKSAVSSDDDRRSQA